MLSLIYKNIDLEKVLNHLHKSNLKMWWLQFIINKSFKSVQSQPGGQSGWW